MKANTNLKDKKKWELKCIIKYLKGDIYLIYLTSEKISSFRMAFSPLIYNILIKKVFSKEKYVI